MRNLKVSLLVLGMFMLSACGGPSEEELNATSTQVAAAIFSTQTANAPTATLTPTNTPTPTPTPIPTLTPTPNFDYAESYFPIEENSARWFYAFRGDDIVFYSYAMVSIDIDDDGNNVYIMRFESPFFVAFYDYYTVYADQVILSQIAISGNDNYTEILFDPPYPVLKFPFEDGLKWEFSSMANGDEVTGQYFVTDIGSMETSLDDFDNCFMIEYSDNRDFARTDFYCEGIGMVAFEEVYSGEATYYEALLTTSASADITEAYVPADDGGCEFVFDVFGFGENETYELIRHHENTDEEPVFLGDSYKSSLSLTFTFYDEEPGYYMFEFIGEPNYALNFMYWEGVCE